MIHELIEPKKKTNKTTSSRITKTLQDNKPFSEHFAFDFSDCENKEAESSSTTTFIPPWLRNSLGLNQRNNQSHAAVGHSDQKPAKIIQRYKGPGQNEFEPLKANVEGDCCKKVEDQFETLSSCCPQEGNAPGSADEKDFFNSGDATVPGHWEAKRKESVSDSSCVNAETKSLEKEDLKMPTPDVMPVEDVGKLEEKKRTKFLRQRSKVRRRGVAELSRNEADCLLEIKTREALPRQNFSTEAKQLETKLRLLIGKAHSAENAVLNAQELRLLQNMKDQVGSIGDFDQVLEHEKEVDLCEIIKNTDFLNNNIGDKKMHGREERKDQDEAQNCNEDGKSNADKDSLLSTDDENDIKRFSEFLSKNKNVDEKRKCLEEVRNYFEKKRKSRLSKRRYLDELKSKMSPEFERKEECEKKEKLKCKELFTILPSRGRKSKFALCDEEVVEKAVDETLQKFVELYHFHVSPKVMGNMKKNILQAMQSDSLESSCSKMNLAEGEEKAEEKVKGDVLNSGRKEVPKNTMQSFLGEQAENSEVLESVAKEGKKKSFKTLLISSNERLQKHSKEIDVVENERLKRLNKEFENFLQSIQNHIEVSNLKIQSVILEKEDHGGSSKRVQFVYNFAKKILEGEKTGHWQSLRETQATETRTVKEAGVQASLKKELTKKSVRIQVTELPKSSEKGFQTDDKSCNSQSMQTESENVPFRDWKELKSFEINPGLYRMVKSREAGKFYLYPEDLESGNAEEQEKSDSTLLKEEKSSFFNKKRDLQNVTSKERAKEKRVFFREKEKGKLKKNKKPVYTVAHVRGITARKERVGWSAKWRTGVVRDENSVDCLYFRNLSEKNSESVQSRKEEQPLRKMSVGEAGEMLNVKAEDEKGNEHMGCVWFWNGQKITPGCDLKTHVEDLLKEKLREISDMNELLQGKTLVNSLNMAKNNGETVVERKISQKNVKNDTNTVFCLRNFSGDPRENSAFGTEVGGPDATCKTKGKKMLESEDVRETRLCASHEKTVRSVATQNSQQTILSFNLTRTRTQSKTAVFNPRKKHKQIRPLRLTPRKLLNFRRAEEIIRAVEEIKNLKLELEELRRNDSRHSDSLLGVSSSSSTPKNNLDDSLTLLRELRDGQFFPRTPTQRLKKVVGFTEHEVQTTDPCDPEEANSEDSLATYHAKDSQKHLELIENVLCKVNQKERESLWNDVREFIKAKIGRDINDEGAREVCIEIEQDMPRREHGTVKQAVMARGHYVRNEGDVEVEIDLTLDDLEKILRQRQRRIRRQNVYRRKNKRLLSSSSFQSELARGEGRRYEKYLSKVAALRGGFLAEQPAGVVKKKKGN